MVLHYNAYNFTVASELPLPELVASDDDTAQVVIRRGQLSLPADISHGDDPICESDAEGVLLHWQQVGGFRISNGQEIVVDAVPGVDERIVRLPLLGTVMATLLHQQGLLVLHASAVAIGDTVAIFLGEKGQGKSTLAAALCARGHRLVSDDIVAIRLDGACQHVLPGYPHVKLWPESVVALGAAPEQLPELGPGLEKRLSAVDARFSAEPLPPGHLFVLLEGPTLEVTALPRQAALLQLVAHTYVARFGSQLLHGQVAVRHFQQCQALLHRLSISRLQRPRNLALLPELAALIEETLCQPVSNP